ncbi:MAG: Hsp20/alpha crystallin family protein [Gammaproteobacteria bacterium]|nr:Hsp20/alpha crystallin family protein [Gammaproteobacteria bacterium]
MSNLMRYEPFEGLFEDVMKNWFRPLRRELAVQPMQITLDLTENDKEYNVRAEIPGVKKEDISITIDGNRVSLSAEIKKEKEEKKDEKVLRSERYYGRVYRSFTLDQDVDEGKAEAKYKDGVLELKLPKKAGPGARRVAIQ